jgi:hypothetical protein
MARRPSESGQASSAGRKARRGRSVVALPSQPHRPPPAPEGFVIGGVREILVYQAYRPLDIGARSRRSTKEECCKTWGKTDPSISVTTEYATTGLAIKVTVKANHPCGIKRVGAYLANKETKQMPPGVPVDSYMPIFINDHFIDESANVQPPGPADKTFTLPVGELIDEFFYVVGSAVSTCDSEAHDHAGPFLLV